MCKFSLTKYRDETGSAFFSLRGWTLPQPHPNQAPTFFQKQKHFGVTYNVFFYSFGFHHGILFSVIVLFYQFKFASLSFYLLRYIYIYFHR